MEPVAFRMLITAMLILGAGHPLAHAALVPGTAVIEGVAYQTFVEPDDPSYRIVCLDPCQIPLLTLQAASDGFRSAKLDLLALTGVDTVPDLKPVDLYYEVTPSCPLRPGFTGYVGLYYPYGNGPGQPMRARACLFLWHYQQAGSITFFTPEGAGLRVHQELVTHEYAHTIFFRRGFGLYYEEEVVTLLGKRVIGATLPDGMCSEILPVYGARFPYELCMATGADEADLKAAIVAIDALFQNGLGFHGMATSTAQFKAALDQRLLQDTARAFLDSGYPVQSVGGVFEGVEDPPGSGRYAFNGGIDDAFRLEGWSSADAAVKLEYPMSICPSWNQPFLDPVLLLHLVHPNHREGTNVLPPPSFGVEAGLRVTFRFPNWSPPAGVNPVNLKVHVCRMDQPQLGWQEVEQANTVLDAGTRTISFTIRSGGTFGIFQTDQILANGFQ